ncbi:aldo/keto reductase [Paenibacillus oryzisoli]|uniref:aldo/keto reductase n=1 Tax=Paenibacillus oryzisoli TaxID=1850517 RepID=UPI00195E68DD|nr:aldo/keto reductase [Paenibacillus oryzisoli]
MLISWGQPDEAMAARMVIPALNGGITCLDTASVYGNAEQVLGRFLREKRGRVL